MPKKPFWWDVQFKRPGEAWVTVNQLQGNRTDANRILKRERTARNLPASINWRIKIAQVQ